MRESNYECRRPFFTDRHRRDSGDFTFASVAKLVLLAI